MSLTSLQHLATSRCNGIWETTRHNGHNGLLPASTCYGLATGVMDFSFNPGSSGCYSRIALAIRRVGLFLDIIIFI